MFILHNYLKVVIKYTHNVDMLTLVSNTLLSFNSDFNSEIILSFKFTGKSFGVPFDSFKIDICLFKELICNVCSFCSSNNLNSKLEY